MLGNGTTRKYQFDNRGQLTTQIEYSGATPLCTIVDGYDAVGNRITRKFNGNPVTWTYDDLYRLTGQQKAGQVCTYTLDGVGNLKTMWEGGGLLDVPRTFTFDAADRLVTMVEGSNLTTYTWTGYGALQTEQTGTATTSYTFSGQDQLIGVTESTGKLSTYTFDGDGLRRTAQNGNVQPTTMVWDGSDYLLLNEPTQNRVVLTLDSEIVSCGTRDLLTDPLGTLVKEISAGPSLSSLFEFYPYGSPVVPAPILRTPFAYAAAYGYFNDTSDRDYVRARELYKKLGRWMQVDPLWPEERSYDYALASPLRFTDPKGTDVDPRGCRDRTRKYCNEALRHPSNSAIRCFCRVSWLICRFLIDRGWGTDARDRKCLDCLNKCLFEHFEQRFSGSSPCWSVAVDPNRNKCLFSGDKCNWYIRCEQKTFTGCLGKDCASACAGGVPPFPDPFGINPVPFPVNGSEAERMAYGQANCCDGGRMGAFNLGPLDPGDIIRRIDDLNRGRG